MVKNIKTKLSHSHILHTLLPVTHCDAKIDLGFWKCKNGEKYVNGHLIGKQIVYFKTS